MMSEELTLEERKVIYRARRGLKEIDVFGHLGKIHAKFMRRSGKLCRNGCIVE